MAREKNKVKWEPTQKLKHPDGIISSDYANAKPFIPSYEKDPKPDMKLLMSMEYARKWQKELEELRKPVVSDKKPFSKTKRVRGENKNTSKLKHDLKMK